MNGDKNREAFELDVKKLHNEVNVEIKTARVEDNFPILLSIPPSPDGSVVSKYSKPTSPTVSSADGENISMRLYDRLLEELKCPGCATPMRPPIFLCLKGHSVCEKCVKRKDKCPLCRGKFSDMRSYTIEALCTKAQFKCINANGGCNARLPLDLLDWHEKQCQYKAIKCFMGRVWGDCEWLGQESSWKLHLKTAHPDKMFNDNFIELIWILKEPPPSLVSYYVFNYEEETFNLYQIYDKQKSRILWSMATCSGVPGNRDKPFKFSYEIQIYKKNDESKVISQRYPCHHELDRDILQEGTCVAVPMEQINSFVTIDSSFKIIQYRVSIFKIKNQLPSNKSSNENSPSRIKLSYSPDSVSGNDKNVSSEMILTKINTENAISDNTNLIKEEKNFKNDSDSETDSELDAFVTDMLRKRLSREYMTPNSSRKFWDSNYAYGSMQSLDMLSEKDEIGCEEPAIDLPNTEKMRKKSLVNHFRKSLKYFSNDK